MEVLRAIGLMSGTSLDGVDVALIETDGKRIGAFGPTSCRPYTPDERTVLRQALTAAASLTDRRARPGIVAEAEVLVTKTHADAIETFLRQFGIARDSIGVVGFHGQTVLHRPAQHLTIQLGDGDALAGLLGLPVVFDFRAADVEVGGQGAPLVPVFHRALAQDLARPRPLAILNLGGVANLTFLNGALEPIACDVGPGNALLDDFMLARTGTPYDRDGTVAAQGKADEAWIECVLNAPFFSRPCPKSLDRNEFSVDGSHFSTADGAATLTALTATAVSRAIPHLPTVPRTWIVAGGGARNPTLMRMLSARLAPASVETAEAAGWSVDGLEAQAFAFLAVRRLNNLPISFPGTTGAPRPLTGGVIAAPR